VFANARAKVRSRSVIASTASLEPDLINSKGLPSAYRYLYSALDTFNLGFAVLDTRCRFVNVNEALAQMNNWPQQAHPGKKLHEVLGPLASKLEPLFDRVFSTGLPFENVQLSGRLPKRRDIGRWTEYFFPIKDRRSRVIQVGVFVMELIPALQLQSALHSVLSPANGELQNDNYYAAHPGVAHQPEVAISDTSGVVLSVRQREVLRLMALGKSNREISSILAISVKTVETHRSRITLKLRAPSLAHLIRYAIRHRIIDA
jgi:DNA-binding CsgD family transcriptional regulator/PAS domain-containing protein